jgi:dolichol-phosphate mannosyltransferase
MNRVLVSVFTPVYNEEANITAVYEKVRDVMRSLAADYDYEHVFSDNGSSDRSREILRDFCHKDPRVKAILLSRNFGCTKSALNGIYRCSGNAVIQIDADLQDPPEMIKDFLAHWKQGNKVVYGIREGRDEFWAMQLMRKMYYRLANFMSSEELIPDVGEFRLMDRRIVDELKKYRDYNPYLRGLIANFGFKQTGIPYVRSKRHAGKTSTNIFNLIDYGINGIVSHSTILLRLSTFTGVALSTLSFIMIILYTMLRLIMNDAPRGITTITIFVLFFSGVQMIFLGLIGEYIAKIFNQSIEKPLVIEEELINFHA